MSAGRGRRVATCGANPIGGPRATCDDAQCQADRGRVGPGSLSLHRPGDGWLYRMPTGPKMVLLAAAAVGVAALPSTLWTAGAGGGIALTAYASLGLRGVAVGRIRAGIAELARQVWAVRWVLAITAVSQLILMGPEPAAANTARVGTALVVAALLPLTSPASMVLEALERGLSPLNRLGVDAARAALLLGIALTAIPVLARLAGEVRDAQRARGVRPTLRRGALPFLVLALRHADRVGDALAARGIL